MTKQMPTVIELCKKVFGAEPTETVGYHESRIILGYLDQPVVAYAYGLNLLMVIVKTSVGLRGYTYSTYKPYSKYGRMSGFSEVDKTMLLTEIRTNKLVVSRGVNESELGFCVERYERPVLFEFDKRYQGYRDVWYKVNYRIVRLKTGLLRAEYQSEYSNRFSLGDAKGLLQDYLKGSYLDGERENKQVIIENVKGDTKIIDELKNQVLVTDI